MDGQCFALLIDADNVSARYIKPILTELSKYGNITYKRIYGDWTNTQHSSWKDELLKNSITPIQQFSYTQGKNSTDSAMIIDAMDILYAKDVDGFCIVSSDSDFTRLVSRLRESGKMVIGMGENKTPEFISKHVTNSQFWKIFCQRKAWKMEGKNLMKCWGVRRSKMQLLR